MKKMSFIFLFFLISTPLFSEIQWAGNLSQQGPIVIQESETIYLYVQVYKQDVTESLGQGRDITARFYVNVANGLYLPMTYLNDAGNNDVYKVALKPFSLRPGIYRFAVAVTDQKVESCTHWSDGNFYWVTDSSYGYTNPSYPNHDWFNSFQTLEVLPSHVRDLPLLEQK